MTTWYDTKPAEANSNVPDGRYQAMITKVGVKTSQAGRDYLGATLVILTPSEYAKRKVFTNWHYQSDNATCISIIKRDWQTHMDIFIKDPDTELHEEETLYKFIGNVLEIQLVTKGENQNVYINKFIKRYEPNMVEDVLTDLASGHVTNNVDDDDITF